MPCPVTGQPICKCESKAIITYDITVKDVLRKLFSDHIFFTKLYIDSYLNDIANQKAILKRLLENQDEIGTYVGQIVGQEKGNHLAMLLSEHIKLAGKALVAVKTDRNVQKAVQNLFDEGDQVASFISSLNPVKLPVQVVVEQFHRHNQFVVDLATLRFKNTQYAKEVKTFDAYYNHMLMFSDLLYFALI
jgi:hypothetical protein